jgi:PAS domain S-box-containing protein
LAYPLDIEEFMVVSKESIDRLMAENKQLRQRIEELELAIQERNQADQAAEQNYQMLFREMLDGFAVHEIILDSEGKPVDYRFLSVNPEFEHLTGLKAADIVGKTVLEVMPGTEREWIDVYGQVALTGVPIFFENYSNELQKLFEVTAFQPVQNQFACIFRDTTQHRQAEVALHQKTQELDRYFNSSLDLLCIADTSGHFLRLNPEWEKVLGYPKAELEGKLFLDLVHPDDLQSTLESVSRLSSQKEVLNFENRYRCRDGSYRWIEWRSKPIGELIYAVARDTTERKQVERAQRKQELFLRAILQTTMDGYWVVDATGKVIEVNQAFCEMTGYTMDELQQLSISDLEASEDPAETAAHIQHVIQDGSEMFESRHRRKDGSQFDVEVSVTYLDIDGGRFVSFCHDITKRKQAEKTLRERELFLRTIVNTTMDGYWAVDAQGKLVDANQAFCRMSGYTLEELLRLSISDLEVMETPEDTAARMMRIHENGYDLFETRNRRKDGSVFDIEVSVAYTDLGGGQFICFGRDITQRKQTEEALRLQATALNSTVNAILITDREGAIQWVNPAFTLLTGYSLEEVQGQTPRLLKSGVQSEEFYQQLWNAILVGETWKGEVVNRRKDGMLYHEEMTITPMKDTRGRIDHFIGVKQDITERKRWQEALEQDKEILEQRVEERTVALSQANASLLHAMRVKDEFLANMSHELRTPLTGILGMSEVLRTGIYGTHNEKTTSALRSIEESGQHLLSLINDILDLSKAEAGKIELELRPVLVSNVVQSSLRMVRHTAQKKQLRINTDLDSTVEVILADERRLKQILVNLLSNAVKFTPEGGTIGVEVAGRQEQRRIDLIVWDTGIGISPKDIERLFKPFVQLDAGLERQYGGTGLGLSLVSKLVELHGGSIGVESQPGKGSRFIVGLPWQRPETPAWRGPLEKEKLAMAPPVEPYQSTRVDLDPQTNPPVCLIAEDSDTTLAFLRDFLQARGYRTLEAHNGAEALQRVHEARPDVVLMDVQMPVMDGLTAIRYLRQDSNFETIPMIALTALAMAGDRERCLSAGATDYLSKPVDLDELEIILERVVVRPGGA